MAETKIKRKRSKRAKNEVTNIPDDEELEILEKIVLGTGSDIFKESHAEEDSDDSDEEISLKKARKEKEEKEPAWVDEDDCVTYGEVVRKKGKKLKPGVTGSSNYEVITKRNFEQVMGQQKWSKPPNKSEDSVEGLLNSCGKFIKQSQFLKNGILEFKKLKNLNFETQSEGPFINVVKFHQKSTVAMVAGVAGIVSLFQVDGKQNAKLQSLHFQRYPIHCGSFLKSGEQFLIGSQFYNFFYCHDLMAGKSMKLTNSKLIDITKTKKFCVSPNDDFIAVCGNTGKIFLFAASTKEYIDSFQMNGKVTDLDFNHDGSILYSHGEDGEVYVWEMKSRACIRKFFDEGCLQGTSIGVSPNDQFIACGSSSGIVNIYDNQKIQSEETLLPFKKIYNLVVPATSTQFNSSSELLAIASRKKENALKLVHCSSMSVFSNFPQFNSKIKKPLCLDFSPNSGFFAVGDNNSCAHLFRLKYYGNY